MAKSLGEILLAVVCLRLFSVDAHMFMPTFVSAAAPQLAGYDLQTPPARLPLSADRLFLPIKTDPSAVGVETSAQSVAVIDEVSGELLYAEAPDEVRSIGSITKLMTAEVFLETDPDLTSWVTLKKDDYVAGGRVYLAYDDGLKLGDVLKASLVGSDNTATMSLVRFSGLSEADFVARMNAKAQEWGMVHTAFVDPSGLSAANVSTAREVAVMLGRASRREQISSRTVLPSATIVQSSGFSVSIPSTNELLSSSFVAAGYPITAGKTGYIPQAGYCFVGRFAHESHPIYVAILGAQEKEERFIDAANVADWTYDTYTWPTKPL